jgi:hypothetical protein
MAAQLHTHHKALTLNLDPTIFGSFAEIGAGQEVARRFLQVGAASGTVAKSISAYDKRRPLRWTTSTLPCSRRASSSRRRHRRAERGSGGPESTPRYTRMLFTQDLERVFLNELGDGIARETYAQRQFFPVGGGMVPLDRPWDEEPWS